MTAPDKPQDVTRHNPWIRLLYMVLYVVIFNLVEAAVYIVLVVQFIFHLFTSKPNDRLSELGESLAAYTREIFLFLTYRADDLPFPFGSWPAAGAGVPAKGGPTQ